MCSGGRLIFGDDRSNGLYFERHWHWLASPYTTGGLLFLAAMKKKSFWRSRKFKAHEYIKAQRKFHFAKKSWQRLRGKNQLRTFFDLDFCRTRFLLLLAGGGKKRESWLFFRGISYVSGCHCPKKAIYLVDLPTFSFHKQGRKFVLLYVGSKKPLISFRLIFIRFVSHTTRENEFCGSEKEWGEFLLLI